MSSAAPSTSQPDDAQQRETDRAPNLNDPAPSRYANYQPSQPISPPEHRETRLRVETARHVLTLIAQGYSAAHACADAGVSVATWYRWLDGVWINEEDHAWLVGEYYRARELRGEYYGYEVAELAQATRDGTVPPQQARVAMEGYMWTAARMAPKGWGDKQQIAVSGQVSHAHAHVHGTTDDASELLSMLQGQREVEDLGGGDQRKQVASQPVEGDEDE